MTTTVPNAHSANNDPAKRPGYANAVDAISASDNILGLIGNTPLVFPFEQVPVGVKLEGRNPTGSVFDRAALYTTFSATDLHVEGTAALIASIAQLGAVFGKRTTYVCTDPDVEALPAPSESAEPGSTPSNRKLSHFLELAEVLGARESSDGSSGTVIDFAGAVRSLLNEVAADCIALDAGSNWTIVLPSEATLASTLPLINLDDLDLRVVVAPPGPVGVDAQENLARHGLLVDALSATAYTWAAAWAAQHATSCVVVAISDGAMNETHACQPGRRSERRAGQLGPAAAAPIQIQQSRRIPEAATRPMDLIGNTPLVHASHFRPKHGATISLKLEGMNATGSIKARAARRMVLEAMERGDLWPGRPLVEPSSGNLGLALAMVSASLGIECHLVCDPRMTDYSKRVMAAYGATVHTVDMPDENGSWQGSRLARAGEIAESLGALMLIQYSNPDNALAHAIETAPEILAQLESPPDVCVVGISTGGHMTGLGRAFRARGANTRMVGVDVEGSSIFGGTYEAYRLRGLGLSWWPGNLDPDVIDDVYRIPEKYAFATARLLARREAIVSGGAAGAVLMAATAEAANLDPTQRVLAIVAERGDRYLRNFYSHNYRAANDLDLDLSLAEWTEYVGQLEPIERVWRHPDFAAPASSSNASLENPQEPAVLPVAAAPEVAPRDVSVAGRQIDS